MDETETLAEARERQERDEVAALIVDLDPLSLVGKPVPVRRWLVPDLIPWRSVTMIGGDGGVGKSLLMLQLQVAAALGKKWISQDVTPVKSYGFYAEDDHDELHRRLFDICRHYDADVGDLERMMVTPRVGLDNVLASVGRRDSVLKPRRLYDALREKVRRFGAQLLIVDTVADTFGGNENFRAEVRAFIGVLQQIALEMDGAVVLTAHPSLSGLNSGSGISGSTAWNNSVRSRLYLTRPRNADEEAEPLATERILRSMKANYAGTASDIALTWQDGVFVAEEAPGGVLKTIDDRNTNRVFLECLDRLNAQGRNVSESSNASNYAPKLMATMTEAKGIKARDLQRAMNRLFDDGTIKMGTPFKGPDRHPCRGIVRVADEAADSCGKVREGDS